MSIIYKTTNTKNGKIYIGKSSIDNPLYLGSGIILNQAIKKYGRQYTLYTIVKNSVSTELKIRLNAKQWFKEEK